MAREFALSSPASRGKTTNRLVDCLRVRLAGVQVVPGVRRSVHRRSASDDGLQLVVESVGQRTTTIYDRRRQDFDRHAAYVVAAFITGG